MTNGNESPKLKSLIVRKAYITLNIRVRVRVRLELHGLSDVRHFIFRPSDSNSAVTYSDHWRRRRQTPKWRRPPTDTIPGCQKSDTLLESEFSTLVRRIIFAIFVYLHIIFIKCKSFLYPLLTLKCTVGLVFIVNGALQVFYVCMYVCMYVNAWYRSQVSSVQTDSPAGWCTIPHCEKTR